VGDPKQPTTEADCEADEAWVRGIDKDRAIRMRTLGSFIARGGRVTEARLLEGADGIWTVYVKLSGHKNEYQLNNFDTDAPKRYKDVALAIRSIWKNLHYTGAITLTSEFDHTGPRDA
jgi:hypothetical protein